MPEPLETEETVEPAGEVEAQVEETTTEETEDIWSDPVKAKDAATKARQEAAERRVKMKEFEDKYGVLEEYDEDERAAWLQLAREFRDDPVSAAKNFQTIAANILQDAPSEDASAEEVEAAASEYLTKDQLKSFMDEYQKEQQIDNMTKDMIRKAEVLGYEQGSDEQVLLFNIAANRTGGDLDKAHERVEAIMQARFDKYVEDRKKEPTAPNDGSVATNEAEPPKTFQEARKRAMATIELSESDPMQ